MQKSKRFANSLSKRYSTQLRLRLYHSIDHSQFETVQQKPKLLDNLHNSVIAKGHEIIVKGSISTFPCQSSGPAFPPLSAFSAALQPLLRGGSSTPLHKAIIHHCHQRLVFGDGAGSVGGGNNAVKRVFCSRKLSRSPSICRHSRSRPSMVAFNRSICAVWSGVKRCSVSFGIVFLMG